MVGADAAERLRTALREILRRGREIMAGQRMVGGPQLIAFDLAGVAEGVGRADADAAAMTMTTPFFRRLCL